MTWVYLVCSGNTVLRVFTTKALATRFATQAKADGMANVHLSVLELESTL